MTMIVLLLLVLALILLAVWSQVKINKDTTDILDELDTEVTMVTLKESDLEHRVQVLERKDLDRDYKEYKESMEAHDDDNT